MGASVDVPDGWQKLHHMKRKALARAIAGEDWDGDASAADKVVRGYLQQ